MKLPRHTENARRVYAQLDKWGLSHDLLNRIGAFAVAWGLFETSLERTVWVLKREEVRGERPSTDKSQVSDWIAVLRSGRDDFPATVNGTLADAADAASDLAQYRNSLFHGQLVPLGGKPFFIKNTRWHGEVRKRPSGDAHIEENLLDLAVETAWTLFQLSQSIGKVGTEDFTFEPIEALDKQVQHGKSAANELRHLAALVNHEKY